MKVSEILARKGATVISVKPSDTVEVLSHLLRERRIGGAVVSVTGETIDGIVTERDLAYSIALHKGELHVMPVSAIMVRNVITCSPDDDVAKLVSIMHTHKVRHIPVAVGNRPVGMISIRDVLNLRVDELQQELALFRVGSVQPASEPQDR